MERKFSCIGMFLRVLLIVTYSTRILIQLFFFDLSHFLVLPKIHFIHSTGGIRCERATALLNQMATVNDNLKPDGVYHCRGGIERYIKTFPDGGFWKGKNYLFDRRMEQTPDVKDKSIVESDIDAKCCLCRVKWTTYRGQHKCNRSLCRVPVIVCDTCTKNATEKPESLICELCREGYRVPAEMPDLVSMKRKADEIVMINSSSNKDPSLAKKPKTFYNDRLFLRKLPLTASFQKVKDAFGNDKVRALQWLTDKESGGFYGSCIVLLSSPDCTRHILECKQGFKIDKKKIKIDQVFMKGDEAIFQNDFVQLEFPPIGT